MIDSYTDTMSIELSDISTAVKMVLSPSGSHFVSNENSNDVSFTKYRGIFLEKVLGFLRLTTQRLIEKLLILIVWYCLESADNYFCRF